MGLIHPVDLAAFQRDETRRRSFSSLRRLRALLRSDDGPGLWLKRLGEEPEILLVMDSRTLSCRTAVLGPLKHLERQRCAILAPFALDDLGGDGRVDEVREIDALQALLPAVRTVLSAGHHAPGGALAHELTARVGGVEVVVQHGMLLPRAAPLPPGAHVAAWTEADAEFWRSGRSDVTMHVTGSALLRRASDASGAPIPVDDPPVYCGALHGSELPRREVERVARTFCLSTGARYRPHPAETDVLSRLIHAFWKRRGIVFAPSDGPLLDVGAPVVGMWSTGILEAAAAGIPAWVHHPDPPEWLLEVWERYGLSRWGADPTPAPQASEGDPAGALAELLEAVSP